MTYENVLKFKVKWRSYQARVLENSKKYMADGKVHIDAERTGERSREQLQNELDKKGACLKLIGDYKGMITPFMISSGCNDKYWWKCSCFGLLGKMRQIAAIGIISTTVLLRLTRVTTIYCMEPNGVMQDVVLTVMR